ncbi:chloride channel protein [Yinghuangia soli]|uniref:Chloride channel protein n=1 Tax=Yinghuangia soli TaxID=2908204 RepID=A0AA41Q6J0_9ACTN|nr:chloride channel protein [Yinghuangia soli]MCF2532132.1 chloride channel protein [Yinghuangia soli]
MSEPQAPTLQSLLTDRRALKLLLLSALVGIPVSLVAFWFVGFVHELQHWIWESAPDALGYDRAPWWWGLPTLTLAGLLAVPIITRMPGHGGHVPVHGLGGPPIVPKEAPGVALAAIACLPLGVMLGPEAPLMALGSAVALLALPAAKRAANPKAATVLGNAGSTAGIATIFGSPLIPAVMVLEGVALAGPARMLVIVPCLLACGIGALVFTGFGHWTGLKIGALSLPEKPPAGLPDAGDFLWGIPMAVLVAVLIATGFAVGRRTEAWTKLSGPRIFGCAVAIGVCITAYALIADRSPEEVALSGQTTVGLLAAEPEAWSILALVALILAKMIGWGIALGSLRGGPIFPALMIGSAVGIACGALPGFGMAPALAAGICASGVAATRLPITATVLAAALLGDDATDLMPILIIASVTALLTVTFLDRRKVNAEPAPAGVEPA